MAAAADKNGRKQPEALLPTMPPYNPYMWPPPPDPTMFNPYMTPEQAMLLFQMHTLGAAHMGALAAAGHLPFPGTPPVTGVGQEAPPSAVQGQMQNDAPRTGLSSSAIRRRRRARQTQAQAEGTAMDDAVAVARPLPVATGVPAPVPPSPIVDADEDQKYKALIDQMAAGKQERDEVVAQLKGSVWKMSQESSQSSRLVQAALSSEDLDKATRIELVAELHGHVREAISSPHANFVLEKVVERLPASWASFVAQELAGVAVATARHRYGCRVVCRLLEGLDAGSQHTPESRAILKPVNASTLDIVNEIMDATRELSRHSYGHHVVKALLERGTPEHRSKIARALMGDLLAASRNRHASYIVEQALARCSLEDRVVMVRELLATFDGLMQLAKCQFGSWVVKALLKQHNKEAKSPEELELSQHARCCAQWLYQGADELKKSSKYASRLLEEYKLVEGSPAAL